MFKDKIDITDSLGLKGLVTIKNTKTGEILVKKHNMILNDAKRVLLSKLLFNINKATYIENLQTNNISNLDDLINYSISYMKIFYDSNEVKYTDSYTSLDIASKTEESSSGSEEFIKDIDITSSNFSIDIDSETFHYILKLNINIMGADQESLGYFNTLCIIMEDFSEESPNENKLLFSRIKFDPILLTADSELNFSYYIYF